jgi:type II secretory pathway pseudopilin PulG
MYPMIPAQRQNLPTEQRRYSSRRGFTLVETMIATVLLSMIILSILAVLIGSYRVAAKARYNDHARYVVKSLADQFLTQQTTDSFANTLPLFQDSSATGTGMTWTNYDGSQETGVLGGLTVILGDNTGAPITANVTRTVWYLYPGAPGIGNSGQVTSIPQNGSAGYMLRGDFTITFPFMGTTLSQTVTAVRSVP